MARSRDFTLYYSKGLTLYKY
ncbi:hypothetical protein M3J07_002489 [Ascochyta lentis]